MEVTIKTFDELTVNELYEIYKLRTAVFVVEQKCAYQEVDEADKSAYHIFMKDNEEIQAYCRVLDRNNRFKEVSIGRVIAVKRRCGLGTEIVRLGIKVAQEKFQADKIVIEAQTYARSLYEKWGFIQTSEEFIEDGIPHIMMEWNK